jgi:hypothetical protein
MHSQSSNPTKTIPTLHEKRGTQAAIPMALARYVNDMQLAALRSMESFGWYLAFIRRPLFMSSVVVVESPGERKIAILEEDGSVNMEGFIKLRQ